MADDDEHYVYAVALSQYRGSSAKVPEERDAWLPFFDA
jgi:hypothetical protein